MNRDGAHSTSRALASANPRKSLDEVSRSVLDVNKHGLPCFGSDLPVNGLIASTKAGHFVIGGDIPRQTDHRHKLNEEIFMFVFVGQALHVRRELLI